MTGELKIAVVAEVLLDIGRIDLRFFIFLVTDILKNASSVSLLRESQSDAQLSGYETSSLWFRGFDGNPNRALDVMVDAKRCLPPECC